MPGAAGSRENGALFLMKELPAAVLAEIGFIATEWSLVDHQLRQSLVALWATEGITAKTPATFRQMRTAWRLAALGALPESEHELLEGIYARMIKRAVARNYALHGVWHVVGPDRYEVDVPVEDNGAVYRRVLSTNFADLKSQSDLLRDYRIDLADIFRRLHGSSFRAGLSSTPKS